MAEETVAVAEAAVEAEPAHETVAEEPVADARDRGARRSPEPEAIPVAHRRAPGAARPRSCSASAATAPSPSGARRRPATRGPTRSGPECGRQLYPIGELPEQVQKALNPLKASKKASKG